MRLRLRRCVWHLRNRIRATRNVKFYHKALRRCQLPTRLVAILAQLLEVVALRWIWSNCQLCVGLLLWFGFLGITKTLPTPAKNINSRFLPLLFPLLQVCNTIVVTGNYFPWYFLFGGGLGSSPNLISCQLCINEACTDR